MKTNLFSIIAALICAFSVFSCKPQDETTVPDPKIEITSETQMALPAEGGTFEITYKITEPQEGGDVRLEADEWIEGIDCSQEGKVVFTVDENIGSDARSTVAKLVYSYGTSGKAEAKINIIQDFSTPADYVCEANFFYGQFLAKSGQNSEDNYYIYISDGFDMDEGTGLPDSKLYLLDLYAPGTDNSDYEVTIHEGTYTLGQPGGTDEMTLATDNSMFIPYDSEGYEVTRTAFQDGYVTVQKNDDGSYDIRARLTDTEGKTHDVRYHGEAVCLNYYVPECGYFPIEENIELHCISYEAYADDPGIFMGNNMDVTFRFSDMEVEEEYYMIPGYLIYVEVNMPYNQEGKVTPGTYDAFIVNNGEWLNPFTVWPGELLLFGYGYYSGSYIQYFDGYHWYTPVGLFNKGSLTIEEAGGKLKCTGDFYTIEGKNIKFDYTGNIQIINIPDPYVPVSTLEDDHILNLDGKPAEAEYWGNDSWSLTIGDGNNGDELMIDLFTGGGFEGGITEGDYIQGFGFCGAFIEGSYSDYWGEEYNTWVRQYENGNRIGGGPIVGGTFNVKKLGGNQYELTFDVFDDKFNQITGTWTGEIVFVDESSSAPANIRRHETRMPERNTGDAKLLLQSTDLKRFSI